MTRQIGYCTNVHAGADLATTKANLETHALDVKQRFRPDEPMGVGLWLAAPAARSLIKEGELAPFSEWLAAQGLNPFTLNGFPYGDFHQRVVKHNVYLPTWETDEREAYTLDLITILNALLPPGQQGSISTLPLCWGRPAPSEDWLNRAAERLKEVARRLAQVEEEFGRLITLCLEPEPGCALQTSHDVVRFFELHLLSGSDEAIVRRYLRVCHDVCHAAVMLEPQAEVLARYRDAGISVGKIQVSSAVCLQLGKLADAERAAAIKQLAQFSEDRYLHQTSVSKRGEAPVFYEDLPLALKAATADGAANGEWRVHFHVPVYLESFGHLGTSRDDILECLQATARDEELTHFEVETYAWGVLPRELQKETLAEGIAEEMRWFDEVCQQYDT